jgi:hypothetical protein
MVHRSAAAIRTGHADGKRVWGTSSLAVAIPWGRDDRRCVAPQRERRTHGERISHRNYRCSGQEDGEARASAVEEQR